MYECQIVEVEDINFCHFINYYKEKEKDYLTYEETIEFSEFTTDYNEYQEYSYKN